MIIQTTFNNKLLSTFKGKPALVLVFVITLLTCFQNNLNAQGGNNCANAAANQLNIPFDVNTYNLCGGGNNYTGTNGCSNATAWINPYGGQDRFFAITPTVSGFLNLQFSNVTATGTVYPILYFFEGCPTAGGTCLGSLSGNLTAAGVTGIFSVNAGVTYYIVVDAITYSFINSANCYRFRLQGNIVTVPVQPGCTNMDFSSNNFNGWFGTTGRAVTGPAGAPTPTYIINSIGIVNGRHTIMTGGNDPCGGFPRVDPQGGPYSVRLGNNQTGAEAEQLRQTFTVSQNNSSFTYRYAVVFEDPNHSPQDQPFFRALIRDANGNIVPCSDFVVSAGTGIPGFLNSASCATVRYKPWSTVNVDLSNYIGQNVTVEFTAGDCSHSGHYGYAYIDAACAPSTLSTLGDTICAGQSAALNAPAGYASYNWMPGNINSQNITVSPTQTTTYTLSLTAFNGCVSTYQIPVVVSPQPIVSFNYQAPACDEAVLFNATTNFAFGALNSSWNFGNGAVPSSSQQVQPSSTFPGPGTYPVTLTQTTSSGCSGTVTQNITIPPCVFSARITGDTICPSECYSLNVSTSYGVGPYQYLWSNGSTAPSISVCPAQTSIYQVTVTDSQGFVSIDTAQVTIVLPIQFQSVIQNVSCNGLQDGSIQTNPIGFGPYNSTWGDGVQTLNRNQLAAGAYTLDITDRFGCLSFQQFIITQPAPLNALLSPVDPTCGIANGSLTVTQVTGGTSPYSYSLNNGPFQPAPVFENLNAGSHEIVIRDANGCERNYNTTLQMVSFASVLSYSFTDATCNLNNGAITLQAINGGVAPYELHVNNNNIAANLIFPFTINLLEANDYTISITDANACVLDTVIEIAQHPGPESLTLQIEPATCGLNNASLQIVQVSGGTAPFQYSFNLSDFSTSLQYNNLAPGLFPLSVKDSNACQLDSLVVIPFIEDLNISALVLSHATCFNYNNGSAEVIITSGSAPFDVIWQNGQVGTYADSIAAGTWTVTVTDSVGCVKSEEISISQPDALTASVQSTDVICNLPNGSIVINQLEGGTAPYTFSLNNASAVNESYFIDLAAGTYEIAIQDNFNCALLLEAVIATTSFPTSLDLSWIDATCGLPNGSIQIDGVTGGMGPFKYAIDNAELQPVFTFPVLESGFDQGVYHIHFVDVNECSLDTVVHLQQFLGPDGIETTVQASTCDLDNGALTFQAVGGTLPYQYSFNNSDYGLIQQMENLAATTYQIAVKDSNNCEFSTSIIIPALENVSVNIALVSPVLCHNDSNGAVLATTPAGFAPFQFSWSNGINNAMNNNLSAGVYQVSVTDSNNCVATANYTLQNPAPLTLSIDGPDFVCAGNAVILYASVNGAQGHSSINWMNGHLFGETIQFVTDSSINVTALVTDALGCQQQDQHPLLRRENPQGIIQPDVVEGCAPVCINFAVEVTSPDSIQSYAWSSTSGENGTSLLQKFCFNQSGMQGVNLHLTDIYGCVTELSASNTVQVHAIPVADFYYTPNKADIIDPEFNFYQQGSDVETSFWTFGDGGTSTLYEPSYRYQDTGSYQVCLRVTSGYNCMDVKCKNLEVLPFPTYYAPNAFTPNNDGHNDEFKLYFTYVKEFYMEIYNRWGELIFSSNDHEKGWNGTYKGEMAQNDTYVWKARFKNSLNHTKNEYGKITLIR